MQGTNSAKICIVDHRHYWLCGSYSKFSRGNMTCAKTLYGAICWSRKLLPVRDQCWLFKYSTPTKSFHRKEYGSIQYTVSWNSNLCSGGSELVRLKYHSSGRRFFLKSKLSVKYVSPSPQHEQFLKAEWKYILPYQSEIPSFGYC